MAEVANAGLRGFAIPTRAELLAQLRQKGELRIIPSPLDTEIGHGSIDLSIGTIFLSAERSSLKAVEAQKPSQAARLFREIELRGDGDFVMHPHQFVLTSTFEYLSLPSTLAGLIQSRSTYGRMGIIAATAAYVHPGYKGCPTLELVNVGEVAVVLKPYLPICQLILFSANEKPEDITASRYQCATRPIFTRSRPDQ